MSGNTYLCPNCLKPHDKDAPLSLLLANLDDVSNLNFAEPKSLPVPLRRLKSCRACGGEVDLKALSQGKLDYHDWGLRLGLLAAAGTFAYFLSMEPRPDWPWIGLGMTAAGLLAWFGVGTIERGMIARFRRTPD